MFALTPRMREPLPEGYMRISLSVATLDVKSLRWRDVFEQVAMRRHVANHLSGAPTQIHVDRQGG